MNGTGIRYRHGKGSILTAVVFIAVLVLTATVYIALVVNEMWMADRYYKSTAALNIATAGVETALWEFLHNESLFAGWETVDGKKRLSGQIRTPEGTLLGEYTTLVTWTDSQHRTVESTGYVPDKEDRMRSARSVKAVLANEIFSKSAYSGGDIDFNGNFVITGDIAAGGTIDRGQGTITGTSYENYPLTLPPVVVSDEAVFVPPFAKLVPIDSNYEDKETGQTVFNGNNLTLEPGEYRCSYIDIGGSDTLTANGDNEHPVIIYVEDVEKGGYVKISGGVGAVSGQAGALQIYVEGNGDVDLGGDVEIRAVIYAPLSTVTMNRTEDFNGCIVGNELVLNGSGQIVYDDSVQGMSTPIDFDEDLYVVFWHDWSEKVDGGQ